MKVVSKNNNYYLHAYEKEFLINKELVYKYKLDYDNSVLTTAMVTNILLDHGYNYALKVLKEPKTKYELTNKLTAQYPHDIINLVINKLCQYNFLNDEVYAQNYIALKINTYGKNTLMLKLRAKGIKDEIITDQLSRVNEADVLIKKIPLKLKQQRGSKRMIILKIINYFTQKGYDYNLVNDILTIELDKLNIDDTIALLADIKKLKVRFQGYQEDFLKKQKFIKQLQAKGYAYELITKYLSQND